MLLAPDDSIESVFVSPKRVASDDPESSILVFCAVMFPSMSDAPDSSMLMFCAIKFPLKSDDPESSISISSASISH